MAMTTRMAFTFLPVDERRDMPSKAPSKAKTRFIDPRRKKP
jgi:hypothetical protein